MAIETEIKLRVDDLEGLRRRLESLRGVLRAARHFEDNYVFDFPDGSTRSRGCLVRIRNAGPKWLLTYKGPALEAGPFKTREELETELGDGRAALERQAPLHPPARRHGRDPVRRLQGELHAGGVRDPRSSHAGVERRADRKGPARQPRAGGLRARPDGLSRGPEGGGLPDHPEGARHRFPDGAPAPLAAQRAPACHFE